MHAGSDDGSAPRKWLEAMLRRDLRESAMLGAERRTRHDWADRMTMANRLRWIGGGERRLWREGRFGMPSGARADRSRLVCVLRGVRCISMISH